MDRYSKLLVDSSVGQIRLGDELVKNIASHLQVVLRDAQRSDHRLLAIALRYQLRDVIHLKVYITDAVVLFVVQRRASGRRPDR